MMKIGENDFSEKILNTSKKCNSNMIKSSLSLSLIHNKMIMWLSFGYTRDDCLVDYSQN